MMFTPSPSVLVSVIVPVYNAASYLPSTVASICAQSYTKLEILLINDGSTDGSLPICREWAAKDSRIRVLNHDNCGASMTRNRGIEEATGDYIMFVDSDDVVAPICVEQLLQAASSSDADVVVGDVIVGDAVPLSLGSGGGKAVRVSRLEAFDHLARYEWWGPYCKLYKASFLKRFRFPNATLSEDYVLMVQLFDQAETMAHLPLPLYAYRKHADSLSTTKCSPHAMDEIINTEWAWEYASKNVKCFSSYALYFYIESLVKIANQRVGDTSENGKIIYKACQTRLFSVLYKCIINPHVGVSLKILSLSICAGRLCHSGLMKLYNML